MGANEAPPLVQASGADPCGDRAFEKVGAVRPQFFFGFFFAAWTVFRIGVTANIWKVWALKPQLLLVPALRPFFLVFGQGAGVYNCT